MRRGKNARWCAVTLVVAALFGSSFTPRPPLLTPLSIQGVTLGMSRAQVEERCRGPAASRWLGWTDYEYNYEVSSAGCTETVSVVYGSGLVYSVRGTRLTVGEGPPLCTDQARARLGPPSYCGHRYKEDCFDTIWECACRYDRLLLTLWESEFTLEEHASLTRDDGISCNVKDGSMVWSVSP